MAAVISRHSPLGSLVATLFKRANFGKPPIELEVLS